ncbi:hypothetical protein GXW82_41180 [Streptacidiphilus sp. 4-A2]|nr:hypothetical protein [Streptacidiphilus sp. 4-A2]
MTRVDDTHYTATISATTEAALSYKYVLGASWSDVEKSASCADISNRSLTVDNGTTGDTVLNWGGPDTCGSAEAVIDVTVPSSTPSSGTVYIAGDFSGLGTGMSSGQDWLAGLYPMTRTGTDTWQNRRPGGLRLHPVLQVRPQRQLDERRGGLLLRRPVQPELLLQRLRQLLHRGRHRRGLGRTERLLTAGGGRRPQ